MGSESCVVLDLARRPDALTEAQWRAVTSFGSDVAVAAAAGSGKTRVLVWRYLVTLLHPDERFRAEPEAIVCVTFTEAAARQMRQRIAHELDRLGIPAALKRRVEVAPIATIHGFCLRLLREQALWTPFDPGATRLSTLETRQLWRGLWDGLLADAATPAGAALHALAERYALPLVTHTAAELIELGATLGATPRTLGAKFDDEPTRAATLAEAAEAHWVRALGALRDALLALAAFVPSGPKTRERHQRALAFAARLDAGAVPSAPELDAGLATLGYWRRLSPLQRERVEQARAAFETARDWAPDGPARQQLTEADQEMHADRERLFEVAERAWQLWRAHKRAHARFEYTDLLSEAAELVARMPALFAGRYDAVLVDEFQDTDPLQAQILAALAPAGGRFVVGDLRQAIYGFRHADPAVFRDFMRGLPDGPQVLNVNYRAHPELLGFVNALSKTLWPDDPELRGAPMQPPESPEHKGHDNDATSRDRQEAVPPRAPRVERLPARPDDWPDDEAVPRDLALAAQAEQVAHRIEAWHADAEARARAAGRPFGSYGEVAVLLRVRSVAPYFERAFARRGIPARTAGGRGFFSRPEIADVANFLSLLEDPFDDVTIASVWRSPLGRLDDEALFWIARARRALHRRRPADEPATGGAARRETPLFLVCERRCQIPDEAPEPRRAALEAAWRRLFDWHETFEALRAARTSLPLAQLVAATIARSGAREAVATQPDAAQCAANLDRLVELAAGFEGSGVDAFSPVARFAAWLALRRELDDDAPNAPVPETEAHVTLTTIHGAKGLEWPLVVLADLGREFGRLPSRLDADGNYLSHSLGVSRRFGVVGKFIAAAPATDAEGRPPLPPEPVETLGGVVDREDVLMRESAEERRLLYVGCTRAKERLWLVGQAPGSRDRTPAAAAAARHAGDWIDACLSAAGTTPAPPPTPVPASAGKTTPAPASAGKTTPAPAAADLAGDPPSPSPDVPAYAPAPEDADPADPEALDRMLRADPAEPSGADHATVWLAGVPVRLWHRAPPRPCGPTPRALADDPAERAALESGAASRPANSPGDARCDAPDPDAHPDAHTDTAGAIAALAAVQARMLAAPPAPPVLPAQLAMPALADAWHCPARAFWRHVVERPEPGRDGAAAERSRAFFACFRAIRWTAPADVPAKGLAARALDRRPPPARFAEPVAALLGRFVTLPLVPAARAAARQAAAQAARETERPAHAAPVECVSGWPYVVAVPLADEPNGASGASEGEAPDRAREVCREALPVSGSIDLRCGPRDAPTLVALVTRPEPPDSPPDPAEIAALWLAAWASERVTGIAPAEALLVRLDVGGTVRVHPGVELSADASPAGAAGAVTCDTVATAGDKAALSGALAALASDAAAQACATVAGEVALHRGPDCRRCGYAQIGCVPAHWPRRHAEAARR